MAQITGSHAAVRTVPSGLCSPCNASNTAFQRVARSRSLVCLIHKSFPFKAVLRTYGRLRTFIITAVPLPVRKREDGRPAEGRLKLLDVNPTLPT